MAGMAAALPYVTAAAGVANTIGTANARQKMLENEAAQLHRQGVADQAVAVQDAKQERRRAELLRSRVAALVSKSGTSMDSPDVINTISDIDAQGEYNALAALHSGYSSAASKKFAAKSARARGRAGVSSAQLSAGATIFDEAHSYYGDS